MIYRGSVLLVVRSSQSGVGVTVGVVVGVLVGVGVDVVVGVGVKVDVPVEVGVGVGECVGVSVNVGVGPADGWRQTLDLDGAVALRRSFRAVIRAVPSRQRRATA